MAATRSGVGGEQEAAFRRPEDEPGGRNGMVDRIGGDVERHAALGEAESFARGDPTELDHRRTPG